MTALILPSQRHASDESRRCYSELLRRELDEAEAWSLLEAIELFEWVCKQEGRTE